MKYYYNDSSDHKRIWRELQASLTCEIEFSLKVLSKYAIEIQMRYLGK